MTKELEEQSTGAVRVVMTRTDLQRLRVLAARLGTTPPRLVRDAVDAMLQAEDEPPLEPLDQVGWGGPRVKRKEEGT